MHNLKKYILLFCTYKMAKISRKTWQKILILVELLLIVSNGKKWLTEKLKTQICGKYQPCRRFLEEGFAI